MKYKDWIPISISVFALVFSVFTWWSAQNEAQRAREREYLEDFLRPLKFVLNITRDTHRSLIAGTGISTVESTPDYVEQKFYQSLIPGDPRRVIWRFEITRLMNENKKAVELVERYIGRVESNRLRTRLLDFKEHALDWQAMWDETLNLPPGFSGSKRIKTEPFPAGLDELLDNEISRVEALVGRR
jgi:hypothetical protein